ncbi:hypothetical protein CC78DRAFT_586121 [Lojkania enalia]|uniref:Uncharacterized protein n=1 Tax=Lojkania enalia TaxID=147567 RepID=A0A9P4N217_9PLEO|nr:hypothetical protein CC78DRAFT_586121 [Didymosphaeria enalia]
MEREIDEWSRIGQGPRMRQQGPATVEKQLRLGELVLDRRENRRATLYGRNTKVIIIVHETGSDRVPSWRTRACLPMLVVVVVVDSDTPWSMGLTSWGNACACAALTAACPLLVAFWRGFGGVSEIVKPRPASNHPASPIAARRPSPESLHLSIFNNPPWSRPFGSW